MFEYTDTENGQLALTGLSGLPVGKGKLMVQRVPAVMAATLLKPVKVWPRDVIVSLMWLMLVLLMIVDMGLLDGVTLEFTLLEPACGKRHLQVLSCFSKSLTFSTTFFVSVK